MFKRVMVVVALAAMFAASVLLAQPADTTATRLIPDVPAGFNWLYIPVFFVGMCAHFVVAWKNASGGVWSKIPWSNVVNAFTAWFFGDKRYTLIAGAAGAILAFVQGYGLNISFGVLNGLGVFCALAAGYIGDSVFNKSKQLQQASQAPPQ